MFEEIEELMTVFRLISIIMCSAKLFVEPYERINECFT